MAAVTLRVLHTTRPPRTRDRSSSTPLPKRCPPHPFDLPEFDVRSSAANIRDLPRVTMTRVASSRVSFEL